MHIATRLIHFDDRSAICSASLENGEQCITLYASALAIESQRYADLAQQRAVDLVLGILEQGLETLGTRDIEVAVAKIVAEHVISPHHTGSEEVKPAAQPEGDVLPEISPTHSKDQDDATTLSVGGAPW